MVIDGLLALHEVTVERSWLDAARRLAGAMVDLFWDPETEGFFDTGRDHETLVVRPRSLFDSAVPCGSSVAADVLLRLAVLTGESDLERRAVDTIRSVAPLMGRYPSGFGRFLAALDFHLGSPVEVALVWPGGGPDDRPRALSWRRSSAATSRTGCSPAGWRAPAGTCRSWPASGRAAGRPPTCARGTRARRPRPSRPSSAASSTGAAAGRLPRRSAVAVDCRRGRRRAIVCAPFPATPTRGGDTHALHASSALVTAVLLLGAAGPALAQTFVFGGQGEPVQFDPAVITDGISAKITRQIYDTLVRVQAGHHRGPAGARREGGGVGRRQGLDARAPQEREVPRRRAVRRQGRGLELRALDEAPSTRSTRTSSRRARPSSTSRASSTASTTSRSIEQGRGDGHATP